MVIALLVLGCLQPTDDLTRYSGTYLRVDYIAKVKAARTIYQDDGKSPVEIVIDPARAEMPILIDTQHEGWGVDAMPHQCITPVKADTLTLTQEHQAKPVTYRRVSGPSNAEQTAFLSKLIKLEGCYVPSGCFRGAELDGKPFAFQRDPSELALEGSYIKVEGEALFRVLVPAGKGWRVYQSTWVTDDAYVKPALDKPWMTLTPAARR